MTRAKGDPDMPKGAAAKRQLINARTGKRFVRRDQSGRFNESADVGRWLALDRQRRARPR
jgi:hypothetical protein